jgi:hypothetical protein
MPLVLAAGICLAQVSNPNEHTLTLSGAQTWTDTGIDLAAGDTATVTVEAKPGADASCNAWGLARTGAGDKFPMPTAPVGTVLGKPAKDGEVVVIGAKGEVHAGDPGHLFLGLNQTEASNCSYSATVAIAHGSGTSTQNATSAQTGMRDKLSSAAQVFMKAQFGKESGQSESNSAVEGNAAMPGKAAPSATGGLKLPSVILDADLRKNLDGVPRRVHDAKGNLGDMINFVMVGSQEKVQAALSAADWHVADLDSKEAGLKAVLNTYQKKDYLEMPMSHLYLWDRMQDFGYEQAEAFSVVATRHHFRIWKAPFTYNNVPVWVGAATHDTGFEKDVRTGKLTHKIDPNVDAERENLASGLQKSGKAKNMTYYLPPNPVQEAKNASGGSYHSDGRLLVVFLN